MTLGLHVSAIGLPDTGRPGPYRPVRKRRSPARLEALVTSICVAGGLVLALTTLPPVQTPGHVIEAFAKAAVMHHWSDAWSLLCRPERASVDADTFAARAAHAAADIRPPDVVYVETHDVRRVQRDDGPALMVAVTVKATAQDGHVWRQDDELRVVLEEEGFRVCLR